EAVVQSYIAGSAAEAERPVIIRIPRVNADMSDEGAAARLALLADLLKATVLTQHRLAGSAHVAEVIDHGEYEHRLNSTTSRSTFAVYTYVDGPNLAEHMKQQFGESFHGIPHAPAFFAWARRLTLAA